MKRSAGRVIGCTRIAAIGCDGMQQRFAAAGSGLRERHGTIVDAATNAPIAGAVVTIDTVLTATTDASGKFSIDKVPSGIADYAVQANGLSVARARRANDRAREAVRS